MIQVYTNPLLLDFIKVCALMPADERAQLEAMTGEPYDVDQAALGNFVVPGPKWVVKGDEQPLTIGGFVPQRKGVWRDFLLTTPAAFDKKNWFTVTRCCRRAMDALFKSGQAHRVECIVPTSRLQSRSELSKWYKLLGYNYECLLHGYCANGADAAVYSRVEH